MARHPKTLEMHSSEQRAVTALEEKLSFLEVTVDALHVALVDKEKVVRELENRVAALEGALRMLAQKVPQGDDVLGALPEEDPVPRSG
jgi:uncharacterized coiled-coil protein SlyX